MTRCQAEPAFDPRPVVLFDGECGLCDRSVRFLLRHERQATLRFAPLASDLSRQLLLAAGLDPARFDSVVLVDAQGTHSHSTAALRLAGYLQWPWRLAGLLLFVPRLIRDSVYNFIAHRRKQWFGTADVCKLADDVTRAHRQRILTEKC